MGRRKDAVVSALALLALFGLAAVAGREESGGIPTGLGPGLAVAGLRDLPEGSAVLARRRRQARVADRAVDRALRRRTLVRRGPGRERKIALTFDDGPSPFTAAVVHVLRRTRTRATFFPVGSMFARWPRELEAVRRGDFEVGDHTVWHPFLPAQALRGQLGEIRGQARALRAHGFRFPRLMRPPYGAYDRRTVAVARRLRMLVVLWSVDSRDFTRPGVKAIVETVVGGARPGAIVLMHDGGGPRGQTVAALPRIVRALHRRGYRLVTVPELFVRG
jgi:peptidoglycan/xylan/chitin deacetylase (PgdA/CDA1 family)